MGTVHSYDRAPRFHRDLAARCVARPLPQTLLAGAVPASLSPGVKQIAIFLVPLYLIWTWQAAERNKPREVLLAALVIASVPVVSALPFVAWNAEGFAKSIILSLTRVFDASYAEPSVDVRLGWTGIPARLPLLGLVPLVYWITWRRKIGMYTSVLL